MFVFCRTKRWKSGKRRYTCGITTNGLTSIETNNLEIMHEACKTNDDIKGFETTKQNLQCFPRALNIVFLNLTHLSLEGCGLNNLVHDDLVGMTNLEFFSAQGNMLTSLPNDLLLNKSKLTWINFDYNRIERLSAKLLDPIKTNKGIVYIGFGGNSKIDDFFYCKSKHNTLKDLMRAIDRFCDPPDDCQRIVEVSRSTTSISTNHCLNYQRLFRSGKYSDFEITIGDEILGVHKCILAVQSEVFDTMFSTNMQEIQQGKLVVNDFSVDAFKDFLFFLYTGKLNGVTNAMEVFALAFKYDVVALKKISGEIIEKHLNESNAIEVLNLASLHSCDVLKRSAFNQIEKFLGVTLNERFMNQPEHIKELVNLKRKFDEMLIKDL